MRSNEIESYKKTLTLTDRQREVLIGTLLGDGHLETQNNGRTYRLKIEHTLWQKEYVDWLYELFRDWVTTSPRKRNQSVLGKPYEKYGFQTLSHGAFRFYAQQFYLKKRKILPRLLAKWLSPLVMAVWFMDDGSIKSNRHRALILNTQCFTRGENLKLIEVIQKKFGIIMSLRPQRNLYQLYIGSESVGTFADLIRPYILSSMRYKLGKLGNTIA